MIRPGETEEEWRDRMWQKTLKQRGFFFKEREARESQRRALRGQATKKKVEEPAPVEEAPAESIKPCIGECGRDTRPLGVPKEAAPHTVTRDAHGRCRTCDKLWRNATTETERRVKYCSGGCGRLTRPSGTTVSQFPGTIERRGGGRCRPCELAEEKRRKPPRVCAAADCNETLPPTARDLQQYCSKRCKDRMNKQDWRARKSA